MATVSVEEDVREQLRLLGIERAERKMTPELKGRINAALARSRAVKITKTDAAALLQVHRTTLYRVYNV